VRVHYAVDGKLPSGKRFRGIVAATPNGVVLSGPKCLGEKPWDKRPLLIPELRKLARVERAPAPRLGVSIEDRLKWECQDGPVCKAWTNRALFLQFVEDVRDRMARDA